MVGFPSQKDINQRLQSNKRDNIKMPNSPEIDNSMTDVQHQLQDQLLVSGALELDIQGTNFSPISFYTPEIALPQNHIPAVSAEAYLQPVSAFDSLLLPQSTGFTTFPQQRLDFTSQFPPQRYESIDLPIAGGVELMRDLYFDSVEPMHNLSNLQCPLPISRAGSVSQFNPHQLVMDPLVAVVPPRMASLPHVTVTQPLPFHQQVLGGRSIHFSPTPTSSHNSPIVQSLFQPSPFIPMSRDLLMFATPPTSIRYNTLMPMAEKLAEPQLPELSKNESAAAAAVASSSNSTSTTNPSRIERTAKQKASALLRGSSPLIIDSAVSSNADSTEFLADNRDDWEDSTKSRSSSITPTPQTSQSVSSSSSDKTATGGDKYSKSNRRNALTKHQKQVLKREFSINPHPTMQRMAEIGTEIGMHPRKVRIWHQNQRAQRKKKLESI